MSALKKNLESGFFVTLDNEESLYKEINKYFDDNIWTLNGVVSPEDDEQILKLYQDVYSQREKSENAKNKKLEKLKEKIREVYISSINFNKVNW